MFLVDLCSISRSSLTVRGSLAMPHGAVFFPYLEPMRIRLPGFVMIEYFVACTCIKRKYLSIKGFSARIHRASHISSNLLWRSPPAGRMCGPLQLLSSDQGGYDALEV
jgi:hypothetical protein